MSPILRQQLRQALAFSAQPPASDLDAVRGAGDCLLVGDLSHQFGMGDQVGSARHAAQGSR